MQEDPEREAALRYVREYIAETNPYLKIEDVLAEMEILPLKFNEIVTGFAGVSKKDHALGKVISIRMVYVDKKMRGRRLAPVLQSLFRQFASEGYSFIEGWASPFVTKWLQRELGIQPRLSIFTEIPADLLQRIDAVRNSSKG